MIYKYIARVATTPIVTADGSKAFVAGGDFRLYVNYWDGTQWLWADLGQPSRGGIATICNVSRMSTNCN